MISHDKKVIFIIFFIFIIFIFSCSKKVIIPATKDAALFSELPKINFSGKNEAKDNVGYITKKRVKDGFITYPAMYLYSGSNGALKESFIVGGFDLSGIRNKIKHASLKFFVNYSSTTRKNVCIFIRPVKKHWDESKITYLDIYTNTKSNAELKDMIDINEKRVKLIVFDVKENNTQNIYSIPLKNAKKVVSVDVTNIVNEWIKDPEKNHGFLIDPMWMDDFRYITTNEYKEISDFGVIEIATTEWFDWNGIVPEDFNLKEGKWINIKNNAVNKIKYIPRLEISYK